MRRINSNRNGNDNKLEVDCIKFAKSLGDINGTIRLVGIRLCNTKIYILVYR